ncbi:hypothetical protein ANN_12936 [Periplaneta americana]|uniref:Uncharacterized protein n=1 Tax=Periplaneta americana TaxID=6978 RepID=A0ABQ8TJU7_PERAM|nr:hypothetical protein ANN_12936 [Periplaneta americana]
MADLCEGGNESAGFLKAWRHSLKHSAIGPFSFIEATINGNVYLDMCRTFVVDQRPQDRFSSNKKNPCLAT